MEEFPFGNCVNRLPTGATGPESGPPSHMEPHSPVLARKLIFQGPQLPSVEERRGTLQLVVQSQHFDWGHHFDGFWGDQSQKLESVVSLNPLRG